MNTWRAPDRCMAARFELAGSDEAVPIQPGAS